jgi:glutaminyl-tRNA synthetase
LPVTITSWPEDSVEQLDGPCFPADVGKPGSREVPFSREILIDRDDFSVDPPAGWQRLAPGRTVRLRHGYCITCDDVVSEGGEVVGLKASHVPDSVGKKPAGVTVSGVIHWVAADHAVPAEVRLYDRLFSVARPDDSDAELSTMLNPDSLQVVTGAVVEPSLAGAEPGSHWQLERVGYFVVDQDSAPGALRLNRTVTLRDSWSAETEEPAPAADARAQSAKAKTRPPKKRRTEYRAEARLRDPVLAERLAAWPAEHGMAADVADLLTADRATGDLFLAAVAAGGPTPAVARWMVNELPAVLGERELADTRLTGEGLGALVTAVERGEVTGAAAKEVFGELVERGGVPAASIAERGLAQVSDEGAVAQIVDQVLAANAGKVEEYRAGKTALFGFFVGQVVRASQGKANPQVVQTLLAQRLS